MSKSWMTIAVAVLAVTHSARGEDAVAPEVSELTLRASVCTSSAPTLADVISFDAADPALRTAVAGQSLFSSETEARGVIAHAQIVQRLTELGVNMSRVLISGAAMCEIKPAAPVSAPAAPPAAETAQTQGGDGPAPLIRAVGGREVSQTLADALTERVQNEFRKEGKVEVEFERAGGEFLALTAPPWEFSIRSPATGRLGMREFSVSICRDGKTQRTVRIGGYVKLSRRVLVARRPLAVGAFIRDDDLAAEERLFENESEAGFIEPGELVGQQMQRFVPAGEMLGRGDVKPVDLVRRSRPVTVIGDHSGVNVQITGVALDSGGYGDAVRVRLGETRQDRREVRGVVTALGTVRIAEE